MTEVATTLTSIDKTMKLRRLSDEIAKLQSIKERAENDIKPLVNTVDVLQKKIEKLNERIGLLTSKIEGASQETLEFLTHCQKSIQESSIVFNSLLELTKLMDDRVEKSMANLKNIEDRTTIIHNDVVKQNEEIERKIGDLNIYHARLKKHFEEHLPGQVITL